MVILNYLLLMKEQVADFFEKIEKKYQEALIRGKKLKDTLETPSEEELNWLGKAAEQEDPRAQFFLGWCYKKGEGVERSLEEAVKWHRKAAEQGHADAQVDLGWCYYSG